MLTDTAHANGHGVTFVIPVRNGGRWLDRVLTSVLAQGDGRPMQIIVIDDGSGDGSRAILERYAAAGAVTVLKGEVRGAAAAINQGIRHALHPIICQVDQDVILEPGWMAHLVDEIGRTGVGAAQGYYVTPATGSMWSRVMGLDLEDRYRRIKQRHIDHVCTGNSAYLASALAHVGPFDEDLGYGYDNDMSYRLVQAGYRLAICREATSAHEWRDSFRGYCMQQYGFGYGRLDLVAKYRERFTGDAVSPAGMMSHAAVMALATLGVLFGTALTTAGIPAGSLVAVSVAVIGVLVLERFVSGLRAAVRFRNPAGLFFAPVHLVRDLAWTAAIVTWCARRARGRSSRPSHSMVPRDIETS
jgi:GT2 family glycosyltransferase